MDCITKLYMNTDASNVKQSNYKISLVDVSGINHRIGYNSLEPTKVPTYDNHLFLIKDNKLFININEWNNNDIRVNNKKYNHIK